MIIHRLSEAAIFLLVISISTTTTAQSKPTVPRDIDIKKSAPRLTVETAGPKNVNVGRIATFVVSVRNNGQTIAEDVTIRTQIPENVTFQESDPKPESSAKERVTFYLGTMRPGESKRIILRVLPTKRGAVELGHRSSFSTSHKAAIRIRQSTLKVEAKYSPTVVYGRSVEFTLVVTNPGDAPAEGITLRALSSNNQLLTDEDRKPIQLPTLLPGRAHEVIYRVSATNADHMQISFVATDVDGAESVAKTVVRVLRPMLTIDVKTPHLKYARRLGRIEIRLTNPGNSPTNDVQVVASLPKELQIATIAQSAKFDSKSNQLTWNVGTIQPLGDAVLSLRALCTKPGKFECQVVAQSKSGLIARAKPSIQVEGRANLWGAVVSKNDATEIDEAGSYAVLLVNRGTKDVKKIDVQVELPPGMEGILGDAIESVGSTLTFKSVSLNAGEQTEVEFQAIGHRAGEHLIRAKIQTQENSPSITVEGTAFTYDELGEPSVAGQFVAPPAILR